MNDTDRRSQRDHDAPVEERSGFPNEDRANEDRSNEGGRVNRKPDAPREFGGRKGPEPVRYGDWEKNGRCIDF